MRQLRHIAPYIILLLAVLASCRKHEEALPDGGEAASLTLSIALPEISLGTKSSEIPAAYGSDIVTDPFGENLSEWSDYEKLVDGRTMYRLTVFLVNKKNGELAGYRDIYLGSPDIRGGADMTYGANGFKVGNAVKDTKYASEAVISFKYDSPMHNISSGEQNAIPLSPEQLSRGLYRLIAIANWSETDIEIGNGESVETVHYPGIKDHDGNFVLQGYLDSFIAEYQAQTPNSRRLFKDYSSYHGLMDFTLHSDPQQFLCELAPQPLVQIQDFILDSGENYISCQLKRTWARVRVTVENISHQDLTIHNLSFADNTTKDETFLFTAPGQDAALLGKPHDHARYGAPKITAETGLAQCNALKSFVPETTVPGLDLSGTTSVQNNTAVLFDGYILDSDGLGNDGNGSGFSYALDLEYEGAKTLHLMRARKADGSWDVIEDKPYDIEDGGLYVMQSRRSGTKVVIRAGDNTLETDRTLLGPNSFISDAVTEFQEEFVFRFVRDKDIPEQTVTTRSHGQEVSGSTSTFPRFWIQTYDGKYWLGTPTQALEKIKLVPEFPTAFIARNDGYFANYPGSNLVFWSTVEDPNKLGTFNYMNVNGGDSRIVNGWFDGIGGNGQLFPGDDDGSQFQLTKVNPVTKDARFNDTVVLSTTDPETAVSSAVRAIRRNDFINIYITASYSDKSGEFQFNVKNWASKDFDIEFD